MLTSLEKNEAFKVVEFPEYEASVKFQIWDESGQEMYRSLDKIYCQDADALIFVYGVIYQLG